VERVGKNALHRVFAGPARTINCDRGFNVNAVPTLIDNACHDLPTFDDTEGTRVSAWGKALNALGHPRAYIAIKAV